MATVRKVLTTEKVEVAEGKCFISYLGPGVEVAFGDNPGDEDFHQISDRTFNYGGEDKVFLRKPETCRGMQVIAKIYVSE